MTMNAMRNTKIAFIFTALFSLSICGCAVKSHKPIEWRPYTDIDGTTRYMGFKEIEQTRSVNGKSQAVRAVQVWRNDDLNSNGVPLGNLQLLQTAGNGKMAVLFLQQGQHREIPQDLTALAQGKTVDFYEFGNFRLTRAQFSAKNGICQDFKGENGVRLLMTSNHYPHNSFSDYYTALIDVRLQQNSAPTEIGYRPSFTGQNAPLQAELQSQEQKQGKALAVAAIKEKASILFNIICK